MSLCQFLLEVRGREEEVLICLQQEDRRRRRREGRGENLPIGFEVLKVIRVSLKLRMNCYLPKNDQDLFG